MKFWSIMERAGLNEEHIRLANEKEQQEINTLCYYVNSEIQRVKKECREFYTNLKCDEKYIQKRITQELNKLINYIQNDIKLNGWLIRLGQWQRIYNEDYEKVLNDTRNMDENTKWNQIGHFFDTHKIPSEFRFKFNGLKVEKVG